MTIHPIELESYRRMRSSIDFSAWSDPERAVVERMVHATADEDYARMAFVGELAVETIISALRGGACVVTDAHMVRMGLVGVRELTGSEPRCYLDEVARKQAGASPIPDAISNVIPEVTRSALAMRLAVDENPTAIFVIGNAPTALFELLTLCENGFARPAAIIGLPVGFVGAAESKQALMSSRWAPIAVSNHGRKGGSAVSAASLNALVRIARETSP